MLRHSNGIWKQIDGLVQDCGIGRAIAVEASGSNALCFRKWRFMNETLRSRGEYSQVHYNDVVMSTMASQITSLTIGYSTVYSDVDQRKHQSSVSLAFVRGIHRGPVNSPHKWPVTRKMFPFDDVIMLWHCGQLIETELGNRYGSWPQTGCVTVPGCEAAFLVARQRFPYRSRFNFSVKNMENMLLCNAICDIMHIDFSRKIYCGANDASIGF